MAEHLISEEEAEEQDFHPIPAVVAAGAPIGVATRPAQPPVVELQPPAPESAEPPLIDLAPPGSPAAARMTTSEPALVFGDRKSKQRKPVLVELVSVRYWVVPPKIRSALKMFEQLQKVDESKPAEMFEQIDAIVRRLFRGSGDEIISRMEDDDDDLDLEHITELIKALMARAGGGDPTG